MRARIALVVAAALLAGPALAEEAGMALRSKALAAAGAAREGAPRADLYEQIFSPPPTAAVALREGCEATRSLCYDAGERRIVYRPARRYMPTAPGLTAESVALRHDRVVLRYSFR